MSTQKLNIMNVNKEHTAYLLFPLFFFSFLQEKQEKKKEGKTYAFPLKRSNLKTELAHWGRFEWN